MAIIDKPTDHFTTFLWTGDGTTPKSHTGVGFQADMMWSKIRTSVHQHNIVDTVRGVNQRLIVPNSNNAEDTTCTHGHFDSLDSDGFTTTNAGGNWNVNTSGYTYAGWLWKAGGTAVSNTAGSITTNASVNTTAGFSIVTYTGTGSNATIGHGLGVKPDAVFFKRLDTTGAWASYHSVLGATKYMRLDSTSAEQTATDEFQSTEPTVDEISIGTDGAVNGTSMVAYCFADVKGFSKFGSYVGNNSANGTFVYTGMKPAFVMIKNSTTAPTSWVIQDTKRSSSSGGNPADKRLLPNATTAEATDSAIDLLSNGFKIRSTGSWTNDSANTYIYLAIAEQPFVTSTTNSSIPATAR